MQLSHEIWFRGIAMFFCKINCIVNVFFICRLTVLDDMWIRNIDKRICCLKSNKLSTSFIARYTAGILLTY